MGEVNSPETFKLVEIGKTAHEQRPGELTSILGLMGHSFRDPPPPPGLQAFEGLQWQPLLFVT